jgi:hypothetical protein
MEEAQMRQSLLNMFGRVPLVSLEVNLCLHLRMVPLLKVTEARKHVDALVSDRLLVAFVRNQRLNPIYQLSDQGKKLVSDPPKALRPYELKNLERFKASELAFATHQEMVMTFIRKHALFVSTLEIVDFLHISFSDTIAVLASLWRANEIGIVDEYLWRATIESNTKANKCI